MKRKRCLATDDKLMRAKPSGAKFPQSMNFQKLKFYWTPLWLWKVVGVLVFYVISSVLQLI